MVKHNVSQRMIEWSLWALWGLLLGGAVLWLLVGSVAYWVKAGWLPPDTSGWVQALGTLAAVGVAVWIPAWQKNQDRQDRRLSEVNERWNSALAALAMVRNQISVFEYATQNLPKVYMFNSLFSDKANEALRLLEGCKEDFQSLDTSKFGVELLDRMLLLRGNARYCGYAVTRFAHPVSGKLVVADVFQSMKHRIRVLQQAEESLVELIGYLERGHF